jgi:hypothetical protein
MKLDPAGAQQYLRDALQRQAASRGWSKPSLWSTEAHVLLAVGVLILGSLCVAGIDRDTLAPTCMHYQGEDPTVPPGICQARVVDWCGLNHPEDPIAQCTDKVYGFAPSNY